MASPRKGAGTATSETKTAGKSAAGKSGKGKPRSAAGKAASPTSKQPARKRAAKPAARTTKSPESKAPAEGRRKILALSFFPAYAPATSGGELRLLNIYKELSAQFDIELLSSCAVDGEVEVFQHTPGFREWRIPKGSNFHAVYNELNAFSDINDVSGASIAVNAPSNHEFFDHYFRQYADADIVIHDSPFTLPYDIFFGLDEKPRVYSSYNAEYKLADDLFPGEKGAPLRALIHRLEKRITQSSDKLIYCASEDLADLEKLTGQTHPDSILVPNGLTLRAVDRKAVLKGDVSALFIGSAHAPNVAAAEFIVEKLAPKLPDIHFDIAGSCLAPDTRTPDNVTVHGRVSNAAKNELLEKSSVALNPMSSGSGSNLKVLEYMSWGLPIVSTPFGVRGIDVEPGKHVFSAPLNQFKTTLEKAVRDLKAANEIGLRAQAEVASRYDWSEVVKPLASALQEAGPKPRSFLGKPWMLTLNDYDFVSTAGGGATRIKGLYSGYGGAMPVIGICLTDDHKLTRVKVNENFILFRVPKTDRHRAEEAAINARHHISAADIIATRHAVQNSTLLGLYNLLKTNAAHIAVEHPYLVSVPRLYRDPFIYSSQNHEFLLKQKLLEHHPDRDMLLGMLRNVETYAIRESELVITCSEVDLQSMSRGIDRSPPSILIRNGVPKPDAPDGTRPAKPVGKRSAVFLGSPHMPNIESARFIVDDLAPHHPDVEFHFVGSICDIFDSSLPDNIILHGRVTESEKSAILRASRVALNPMFSGGGSNVKMTDFLAHGLNVISTPFGARGFPPGVEDHVLIVDADAFSETLEKVIGKAESAKAKKARISFFETHLSMESLSEAARDAIVGLDKPRKRALFVTYRFTDPPMGGAEAHMLDFLDSLDRSDDWTVDIVSTEVSDIEAAYRFGGKYRFDPTLSAPSGRKNFRWQRFPLDQATPPRQEKALETIWRAETGFERALADQIGETAGHGLLWGFFDAEDWGRKIVRRAGIDCAIAAPEGASIRISGQVEKPTHISLWSRSGKLIGEEDVEGDFKIETASPDGLVNLKTSIQADPASGPRMLGFVLTGLTIDGKAQDLQTGLRERAQRIDRKELVDAMNKAARASRYAMEAELTTARGPYSSAMEKWLEDNLDAYDLVITHNYVFRPALKALEIANAAGVPSILIPHAHIDDDFYHFPDVEKAVELSTVTAACPNFVADHYRSMGHDNVRYLGVPVDTRTPYTSDDVEAFRALYDDTSPFILVLGRKAGAKGYRQVIRAVERLRKRKDLKVVMIGPDDDKDVISEDFVTYLGPQPRSVVRGALKECAALVNMSVSESFGMVVVEAWAAEKPVIVNRNSIAFADFVTHDKDGWLASPDTLEQDIETVVFTSGLAERLGRAGKAKAPQFDAETVLEEFVSMCNELVSQPAKPGARSKPSRAKAKTSTLKEKQ
ncbi:glycosyltransferase [Henriciella mobilis]|nr:glycosyltransferase [Henriciella mobilis]